MTKLLILYCFCFLIFGMSKCKCEKNTTKSNIANCPKDTIYLKEKSIIAEDFYLTINSINNGANWDGEKGGEYFYRILFSTSEESNFMHVELLQLIADSKIKLIRRIEVSPKQFGLDYYSTNIEFLAWASPKIVNIKIGDEEYTLNLDDIWK